MTYIIGAKILKSKMEASREFYSEIIQLLGSKFVFQDTKNKLGLQQT